MKIQNDTTNYQELAEKYISALKECKEIAEPNTLKVEVEKRGNALAERAHCMIAVYKEVLNLPHDLQGDIEDAYDAGAIAIRKNLKMNQYSLCCAPILDYWIEIPEGKNSLYVAKDIHNGRRSATIPAEMVFRDAEILSIIDKIESGIKDVETAFYADVDRVIENIQNKDDKSANREVLEAILE